MPMPPMPMPVMRPPIGVPMIPVPVIPQTPLAVRPAGTPVTAPIPPPATSTASATDTNPTTNAPVGDGPPPAKKARTEDELESEALWLTKVTGSITVTVQIPSTAPNPDWKLDGRRLSVSMDIAAPVSTLKSFVQDETGLPCSKQKLSYEGLFLKDACTLAYYNMNTGAVVQLLIKERGGKKK
ncbi:hypothetical protein WUBG_01726 [Wuchereria bancrofti]|nr:hypothetical protein WUBG_01726 [Wuchereria bancrofti]